MKHILFFKFTLFFKCALAIITILAILGNKCVTAQGNNLYLPPKEPGYDYPKPNGPSPPPGASPPRPNQPKPPSDEVKYLNLLLKLLLNF